MSRPALGFLLLEDERLDPARILAAAEELGVGPLVLQPREGGALVFQTPTGAALMVMPIPAPHPDALAMPRSPMSPPPEVVEASTAHAIVTALGLPDDPRLADPMFVRLVGAAARGAGALAATVTPNQVFLDQRYFDAVVGELEQDQLPVMVTVQITAGLNAEGRLELLTHGLHRYDAEDVLVQADPASFGDAFDLLTSLVPWFAEAMPELPTGDTIGRSAEERLRVDRVPSPVRDEVEVILLRM